MSNESFEISSYYEEVDTEEFEKRWRLKVNNVEVAVIGPKGFYSTKGHYINPKYILSLFDMAKRDNYV
jgi:hypothetical protein